MSRHAEPPLTPLPSGLLNRIWDWAYGLGYGALRATVLLVFRPLFLVRRVGPPPAVPDGGWILCANHASYLDPAFLQLVLEHRIVFVMTIDFYARPWGRWFFRLVGAIPVASGRLAKQGLEKAVRLLRKGTPIAIFPEGRLSPDGAFSAPQRGVAVIARMGRAPILPAGIYGNLSAWPKGAPRPRRSDVRIAFGPLLDPPVAQPPGRQEERAYTKRIMDAVAQARELARSTGNGARP